MLRFKIRRFESDFWGGRYNSTFLLQITLYGAKNRFKSHSKSFQWVNFLTCGRMRGAYVSLTSLGDGFSCVHMGVESGEVGAGRMSERKWRVECVGKVAFLPIFYPFYLFVNYYDFFALCTFYIFNNL